MKFYGSGKQDLLSEVRVVRDVNKIRIDILYTFLTLIKN